MRLIIHARILYLSKSEYPTGQLRYIYIYLSLNNHVSNHIKFIDYTDLLIWLMQSTFFLLIVSTMLIGYLCSSLHNGVNICDW